MNTIFNSISKMLRRTTGRLALGAVLAGTGAASSASAHDDIHLDLDLRHGHMDIDRHHWVPGEFEDRQTRVWIEPVYNVVPGPRVWVEPQYRTVVDHVWREPVTRDDTVQVWVPSVFENRYLAHGHRVEREQVFVPAHYEAHVEKAVITPGHFEDVARQELVSEGHWQANDQQVLVTPGHWEIRTERVPVINGHWEDRPVVRIR